MTEVGSAYVSILPSTRGFGRRLSSDLSGPSSSAGRSGGRAAGEGFSRSFLPSIKGIAGAAGGLLAGGALFKLGSLGLSTAAGMEQAQISFTTMLGSAQKASSFLKDLQAFAAKTPFEFPELQTAASSLISVGVNAKDVIPIMTTLGNVTSGMGTGSEGVKRATVALQQMIAAQRITGEDLNQLRDAGIPVYDLLSKATGKSTAEVVKMAQAGKLGKKELDLMLQTLQTGKGLERFAGLMDKQSQSLTGLWSTFKDTLGQGLASLLTPVIPKLKSGLNTVSTAMGDFFGGLKGQVGKSRTLFTDLGLGVSAMVAAFKDGDVTSNGLVGAMERIGVVARQAFGFLKQALRASLPALKSLAGIVTGSVLPAISNLWAAIQPLLIEAFQVASATIKKMRPVLSALGAVLVSVTGFLKDHKTIVQAVVIAVGTAVVVWKAWTTAIKVWQAVTKIATAVQAAFNLVMSANPIGLVIIAIAALAAGLIYAYKHSETFRNIVDGAFRAVAAAASFMWNSVLKPIFRLWLNAWFAVIGALVHGAAAAFGWVPGIGGKLKAAARKFDEFRDSVNRSLSGIKDKKIHVSLAFAKGELNNPATRADKLGFASGGRPPVGVASWVGEQGPELWVPDQPGTIVPNHRLANIGALGAGSGLVIEQLNVTSAPEERAEQSVPRSLRALAWANGYT